MTHGRSSWEMLPTICSTTLGSFVFARTCFSTFLLTRTAKEAPLPPVDVPAQKFPVKQAAKTPKGQCKAKTKTKAKAKPAASSASTARSKKLYLRKQHKRGDAIAYTVHDNTEGKQVVQLVNTYVPDAGAKVQTWVDSLNSGSLTVEQVLQAKEDIMQALAG